MDDVSFISFALAAIDWVEERHGRFAAWIVSFTLGAIVPLTIVAIGIWWFAH